MTKIIAISATNKGDKKFFLQSDNAIKIYVCGITPYDYAHIGHGRCYIAFDLLVRVLRFFNQNVTYCRNITDIDDKLINRAKEIYSDSSRYSEIAANYYNEYKKNMDALFCLRPDYEPKATDYIASIIRDIEKLIEKGFAYSSGGDVFFSVNKFNDYGTLSKRNLTEQILGSRVAINENKENSLDFVIWKKSDEKPNWKSPWGMGRPGWHIECSTMISDLFNEKIDIHGGGHDLLFPHHENENVIFKALNNNSEITEYWMHCAFININKQKMSKSLNNFITLNEFFKEYDPMVFRYFILNHHYKTPIEFSWDDIKSFEKSYKSLINLFSDASNELEIDYKNELIDRIYENICNDLNFPAAIGLIFKHKNEIENDKKLKAACKKFLNFICGLKLEKIAEKNNLENNYSEDILEIIEKRKQARINKDFKLADLLRDKLKELGIEINDAKL